MPPALTSALDHTSHFVCPLSGDWRQTETHETALLETVGSGYPVDDTPAEAAARAALNRSLVATQAQLRDVTSEQIAAITRQTKRLQAALEKGGAVPPTDGVKNGDVDDAAAVAAAQRAINEDVTRAAAVRAEHAVASPVSPLHTVRPSPPRDDMATGDSPTGISFPPFQSTLDDDERATVDAESDGEGLGANAAATGDAGETSVADALDTADTGVHGSDALPTETQSELTAPDPLCGSAAEDEEEDARQALVSQVREQAMMIATLTDALHSVGGDHSTAARDERFADEASTEPTIGDDASVAALQAYYDDHVVIIETLCRALNASEAREDAL